MNPLSRKFIGPLPWGKIPTNLPEAVIHMGIPLVTVAMFSLATCYAGSYGGNDTKLTANEFLAAFGEDGIVGFRDAVERNILQISREGTVAVVSWENEVATMDEAIKTRASEAERQRRRRAKLAAEDNVTPVTPVTPMSRIVTPHVTPCAVYVTPACAPLAFKTRTEKVEQPQPNRGGGCSSSEMQMPHLSTTAPPGNSEKERGGDSLQLKTKTAEPSKVHLGGRENLAYPANIPDSDRKAISVALDSLPPDDAQLVLDELTGTLLAGNDVRNKAGWCRSLARKVAAGIFFPERGIAVAERRRQAAAMASMPQAEPPMPMTPDEIERHDREIEATIASMKDGPMAQAMQRGLNALRARRAESIQQEGA